MREDERKKGKSEIIKKKIYRSERRGGKEKGKEGRKKERKVNIEVNKRKGGMKGK